MAKVWNIRETSLAAGEELSVKLGLPRPLSCVLAQRGLTERDAVAAFLEPRLDSLGDPFDLPGMIEAAARIWDSIDCGHQITVFGDYDVDGLTSTALIVRVLKGLGAKVNWFIPCRMVEGYGLSVEGLDNCIKKCWSQLIVTVDCGTNSTDAVERAREYGIDVVVTDHHEPSEDIADAVAVVNPKLGDDPMHYDLAGVGVTFKLCHALIKLGREVGNKAAETVDLREYFDFVAMGTITDVVPLRNENRLFVRYGLSRLKNTCWPGLQALKEVSGIASDKDINTMHVGFALGPRINAAGRIGGCDQAMQLFLSEEEGESRALAQCLNRANRERQEIEKEITDTAVAQIKEFFDPAKHYGLVVAGQDWHPGVVGIVASRISQRFHRPAVVVGFGDGNTGRGSCRSIDSFNVLRGLDLCAQYLIRYGGHELAAGITIDRSELEPFRKAFNAAAAEQLHGTGAHPVQQVACRVTLEELNAHMMHGLKRFEPFGQDNEEPVWAVCNVRLASMPRVVGRRHLKFAVTDGHVRMECIGFGLGGRRIPDGPLDIAFTLQENEFMGQVTLQMNVKDFRPSEQAGG